MPSISDVKRIGPTGELGGRYQNVSCRVCREVPVLEHRAYRARSLHHLEADDHHVHLRICQAGGEERHHCKRRSAGICRNELGKEQREQAAFDLLGRESWPGYLKQGGIELRWFIRAVIRLIRKDQTSREIHRPLDHSLRIEPRIRCGALRCGGLLTDPWPLGRVAEGTA